MKGKYFVIAGLILLLGFTVKGMLELQLRAPLASLFNPPDQPNSRSLPPMEKLLPEWSQQQWRDYSRQIQSFTRVEGTEIQILKKAKKTDLTPKSSDWEPLFLKGFNLGAALPGCFPSEFKATEDQYLEWLTQMADLGANCVRLYTILPPDFYRALARYNFAHSNHPVYLLQGVWADYAEAGSYGDSAYTANFQNEIRSAIDVIHGQAVLLERPGHASGHYTTDVSPYILALVLGREWEPQTVTALREKFPSLCSYHGIFFSVPHGSAMACWMAKTLDFAAQYEAYRYQFQHALSFVNWLPLDPLYHDSEWIEWDNVREYDNDLETLDPNEIYATPLFPAGYFASYHAYPYYPDFVYNDLSYRQAHGTSDSCTFFGYLQDLTQYHTGLPVVIAEFGVPTSRSAAHFAASGMHQGGHSEIAQGQINAHLIRDIWRSGGAGAILFSWMDEWFKHNWLVMDFEVPAERNKLWHNLEDAEQNFGILALEARERTIDGRLEDWTGEPLIQENTVQNSQRGDLSSCWVTSDAACLYFRIDFAQAIQPKDWQDLIVWIGLDTYDPQRGDTYFPGRFLAAPTGLEFVVEIAGPEKSRILVDQPYDVYTDYYRDSIPDFSSRRNADGIYHEQRLLANRKRETLLGEVIPERLVNRSYLTWGSADPQALDYTSLADLCPSSDGKSLELRLPWALLNVTDPSSRSVLDNDTTTTEMDVTVTDGFKIYLAAGQKTSSGFQLIDQLPDDLAHALEYRWEGWETPRYTSRLKAGAPQIAAAFQSLNSYHHPLEGNKSASPRASLTVWPQGASAAVSITFDDGSSNQFRYGKKLLEKYGLRGTFFIITSWTGPSPLLTGEAVGLLTRRLSIPEVQTLRQSGHEIGSHGHEHRSMSATLDQRWIETNFAESQTLIITWTGSPALSMSYPYSALTETGQGIIQDLGFRFGRVSGNKSNTLPLTSPLRLFSHVVIDDLHPDPVAYQKLFLDHPSAWTILQYHHLFPEDAREFKQLVTHDVEERYNVSPRQFERQIRLLRNRNLAEGTLSAIGLYAQAVAQTQLNFSIHDQSYVLYLNYSGADSLLQRQALTVELTSPWRYLRLEGSTADGIYQNRSGIIYFDAYPNTEVIIHKEE